MKIEHKKMQYPSTDLVILAGGQARRMNGINKLLHIFDDEIQLINVNGQLMQQIQNPERVGHSYHLENLPKGFYFVKLAANNQMATKKIIIN